MNAQKNDTAEKTSKNNIDWKQIGRFISIIVKLFSHLTETFKKLNVGPEVLGWITGDGKDVFEKSFVVPLARRYSGVGAGFKNWPAICQVQDWCLRMVLARVDVKSDLGINLQTAFPYCFCETEMKGPVPLSVLQETARQNNIKLNWNISEPEEYLYWMDALNDFNIPSIYGCWSQEHYTKDGNPNTWVLFSEEFGQQLEFGKVVEFKGQKYFVAELLESRGMDECCLVPVECININS